MIVDEKINSNKDIKDLVIIPPSNAGVIIINKDKTKLLLVKGKVKGKWGPPKGKIENKETTQIAAMRELYEETGIKLDINNAVRYKNTSKPYQLYLSNIVFYIFYLNEDNYNIFDPIDKNEIIEELGLSFSKIKFLIKKLKNQPIHNKLVFNRNIVFI